MLHDSNWILGLRCSVLTQFFQLCPFLVSDSFLIALVALLYWYSSKSKAYWMDMAFMICITIMINRMLKEIIAIPRPSIELLISITDGSYGFPSGDVQIFTVVSLMIAYYLKNKVAWIFAIFMIIIIAISRVYLGAHSIMDVISGFVVGYILVLIYRRFANGCLSRNIVKMSLIFQIMLYAGLALIYCLIMQKHFGKLDIISLASLTGFWLGCWLVPERIKYRSMRLFMICLGLIILGLIVYVFKSTIKSGFFGDNGLFICFVIVSFYIAYVAPKISDLLQKR